ncbi:hypothetical protein Mth01_42780 [Sphaerimonospora thailandensis]|uniref:Uncharacterized protein n=2 Tax=Sphaerimonospora thailandensis TaxID=795644 RepID=A0A8J3RBZ6_9ACTN|nr:hypothetical protein Mth01_42780 [Sphaerimonospora thailandensis]
MFQGDLERYMIVVLERLVKQWQKKPQLKMASAIVYRWACAETLFSRQLIDLDRTAQLHVGSRKACGTLITPQGPVQPVGRPASSIGGACLAVGRNQVVGRRPGADPGVVVGRITAETVHNNPSYDIHSKPVDARWVVQVKGRVNGAKDFHVLPKEGAVGGGAPA